LPKIVAFNSQDVDLSQHPVLLSCDFLLLPLRLASALLLVEDAFWMLEEFLSPLEQ
jgi:hypothetical protein